jgi:hypothetical protein
MRYVMLILLLALAGQAMAIGVGPVQKYIPYTGGESVVSLRIFADTNVTIEPRGELKEYISLSERAASIRGHRDISYVLEQPLLSPGPHYGEIAIIESAGAGAGVQGLESVVHRIILQVPYEEDYAEAKMAVKVAGESARFDIDLYNYCRNEISASAVITVGQVELYVEETEIGSLSEGRLTASAQLSQGQYVATARVHYSGKEIVLSERFTIGEPKVVIRSISVDPFKPGDVARIRIGLENEYFEPVKVTGKVILEEGGRIIWESETPETEISTLGEMAAYLETSGLKPGNYSAKAEISYPGGSSAKPFSFIILEERKGLLFMAAVALLIAALYLALKVRKLLKQGF